MIVLVGQLLSYNIFSCFFLCLFILCPTQKTEYPAVPALSWDVMVTTISHIEHCIQLYTWQWSGTELKQGNLGSLGELGRVQAKMTGRKFWAKVSCGQMACRKWASCYQRKERHPKHVSETIVPQLHCKKGKYCRPLYTKSMEKTIKYSWSGQSTNRGWEISRKN